MSGCVSFNGRSLYLWSFMFCVVDNVALSTDNITAIFYSFLPLLYSNNLSKHLTNCSFTGKTRMKQTWYRLDRQMSDVPRS